jgi:hypothetical protein
VFSKLSLLIFRVADINRNIEGAEPDKKKGKLPPYETEKDYQLRRLVDNYGFGGVGPKIPTFPPREKKQKP